MDLILLYFSIKYQGDWDKIYNALSCKEKVLKEDLDKLQDEIKNNNYSFMTVLDKDYPDWFKTAYKPPFVIFFKGNKDLFKQNNFVCLTGDSEINGSLAQLQNFSNHVFKNSSLVTAGFKGIDEAIINLARQEEIPIIIVSANGVEDAYFPIDITKFDYDRTLLISEYPQTHVTKDRYKARNRLIAAICNSLIILSAKKNSGINNLVSFVLQLGKDVMCLPDSNNLESTCNELIKQGAIMITRPEDIQLVFN